MATVVVAIAWSCGRINRGPVTVHVISRSDHHPEPGVRVVSTHRGLILDDRTTDASGSAIVTAEEGGEITVHTRRPTELYSLSRMQVSPGQDLVFASVGLSTANRANVEISVTAPGPVYGGAIVGWPGYTTDALMHGETAQILAASIPWFAGVPSDGTYSIFGVGTLNSLQSFALDVPTTTTAVSIALAPRQVLPVTVSAVPPGQDISSEIHLYTLRKGRVLAPANCCAAMTPAGVTTAHGIVYGADLADSFLVLATMLRGTAEVLDVIANGPVGPELNIDSPQTPAQVLSFDHDAQRRSFSWNISEGGANGFEIVRDCSESPYRHVSRWEVVGAAPRSGSGSYSLPRIPYDLVQGLQPCTAVACIMIHDRSDLVEPLDLKAHRIPRVGAIDRATSVLESGDCYPGLFGR